MVWGHDVKFDDNAAAFGLFQLTFAHLEQQFAAAVFFIRKINDPDVKFEEIFKLRFSDLRNALKRELKQFEGQSSHNMELHDLRKVCVDAEDLTKWRNPRAHPRVQIDKNGIAIYDWRTLQRLTINRDECAGMIEKAIAITVDLDFNVARLIKDVESEKKIHEMLEEIFKTVEGQDG
jgi:hypothetical protein